MQQLPVTSLVPVSAEATPEGLLASFPTFTGPRRAYLIARCNAPSLAEAARQAGVQEQTVYGWRSYFPAFKEAERQLLDARGDASLQLARALAKGAMPGVAQRQITQALRDDADLSDRQLMAQQRARESVAKWAGMEAGAPGEGEERLDILAIRLWRSKKS